MKIFKKVHCKAYLKKQNDGITLICFGDSGELISGKNNWTYPVKVIANQCSYKNGKWVDKDIADLSSFEGETVDKQYRVRVEEEFDGFLVGITNIVTSGRIGTDTSNYMINMNGDLGEVYHLVKYTNKEKVGVVYFKNNARRYVYLDDMEVIEE